MTLLRAVCMNRNEEESQMEGCELQVTSIR